MIKLFLLFLTFVNDVSANDGSIAGYNIWEDLNLTAEAYYEVSAYSGMTSGLLFAFAIILIMK